MESAKAQKIIFTCAVITGAVGTFAAVKENKSIPSRRFIVGSAIGYFGLVALAEAEPDVAAPLAIAVLSTALLDKGKTVFGETASVGSNADAGKEVADVPRTVVTDHRTSAKPAGVVLTLDGSAFTPPSPLIVANLGA